MKIRSIKHAEPSPLTAALTLDGMEWESTALDLSKPTSDGRMIQQDGFAMRTPPLALLYLPSLGEAGHEGAVQVGTIQSTFISGSTVQMAGTWLDSPDPDLAVVIQDVKQRVENGDGLSVSVDLAIQKAVLTLKGASLDDLEEAEPSDEQADIEIPLIDTENEVLVVQKCELVGLTILTQPAQDGLSITSLNWDDAAAPAEPAAAEPVAAALTPVGHVTLPITIGGQKVGDVRVPVTAGVPDAVTAAAGRPPREWFDMPEPDTLTPLTVLPTGQVYGHVAAWGSCHTGSLGACLEPPPNPSGEYPWFNLGARETQDGDVATVGQITMRADHAKLTLGIKDAHDHYANSALAVADVHASEGVLGPWVCGALRPGITEDVVDELTGLKISGDWRPTDEGMEMIAALAVPAPGFVVPRAALAAGSGDPTVTALVAAGVVQEEQPRRDPSEATRLRVLAAKARGGLDAVAQLTH